MTWPQSSILSLPKNKKFILGSASPRRRQLLTGLDIEFEAVSIDADESFTDDDDIETIPQMLAKRKSDAYGELADDEILITADTVVILDEKILNKPSSLEEAAQMLSELSGQEHIVITGVFVRSNSQSVGFEEHTWVRFGQLNAQEIAYYVDKYKPFDKAGAYGVQDWIGYIGVTGIRGCYYNVMGLPINKLYKILCTF